MKNTDKRKIIGKRIESRRKQLGLSQGYLAEQLGVNQSTITRYEKGAIDNEKLIILNAVSSVLHVSVAWLTGDTEDMESDITDNRDLQIRMAMENIENLFPLALNQKEAVFSKELLLLLLKEYEAFYSSFKSATEHYAKTGAEQGIITAMGFDSEAEFREIMFLREITHSINTFNDISDILRSYSKNPEVATNRIHSLLSDYQESI